MIPKKTKETPEYEYREPKYKTCKCGTRRNIIEAPDCVICVMKELKDKKK